jgi:hypothetical protein
MAACGGDDASSTNTTPSDASPDVGPDRASQSSDGAMDGEQDRAQPTGDAQREGSTTDASDAGSTDGSDASEAANASDGSDAKSADAPEGSSNTDSASADAFDADAARDSAASDATDAASSCLASLPGGAAIFGDYYIRSNGSAVNGQNDTVVLDDSTGMPLLGLTQIALEHFGACALRAADGTVWCWPSFAPAPGFGGNNSSGQLGNGTFTEVTDSAKFYHATKVQIATADAGAPAYLDQVTSLQTGSADPYSGSVCAIRADKSLWCWGSTSQGNLWHGTIGTNADLAYATKIELTLDGGAINVDQVTMGSRHICFLSGGNVYCWGANVASEVGTGDTTAQEFPYHVTSLPGGATFVAAGYDVTCALVGGLVFCWGTTNSATTGDPYVDASVCNANYCQPTPAPVQAAQADGGLTQTPLSGQTRLFAGYQFVCAADAAGQLRCWGSSGTQAVPEATVFVNPNAGTGVPSGPVAAFSAVGTDGYNAALRYVTTDGTVVYGPQKKTLVCP